MNGMGTKRYANRIRMKELNSIEKKLNPFPIYEELREKTPVRYDPDRHCWDVFLYDDVYQILKDPATFSSQRAGDSNQTSLLFMDPPKHKQMRDLVNKAFTPKAVNDLAPRIRDIADELLNRVMEQGYMEVVQDFAAPLPIIVIAELLGVPAQDRMLFKAWSDQLVEAAEDNSEETYQKHIKERNKAIAELQTYFMDVIEKRRANPKEDLISALLQAEINGEKLSDSELLGFCILLLAAGNETTTNLITNGVRRLAEMPHLQQMLIENRKFNASMVEEVLRFYPPVQAIGRLTKKDVEISGQSIPAGSQVITWVASANRDPRKFEKPNEFQIDRKPNPHLTFGFGIHFCLGAPLARLEGQIAFEMIMDRMRSIQMTDGTQLEPIPSAFVYGVKQLPISFQAVR